MSRGRSEIRSKSRMVARCSYSVHGVLGLKLSGAECRIVVCEVSFMIRSPLREFTTVSPGVREETQVHHYGRQPMMNAAGASHQCAIVCGGPYQGLLDLLLISSLFRRLASSHSYWATYFSRCKQFSKIPNSMSLSVCVYGSIKGLSRYCDSQPRRRKAGVVGLHRHTKKYVW